MTNEERFTRWQRWFEEIEKQAVTLAVVRHIYETVAEIVSANPRLQNAPGDFVWWMAHTYRATMLVGLWALGAKSGGVVSLYRLLDDIRKHPKVLSRERFLRFYGKLINTEPVIVGLPDDPQQATALREFVLSETRAEMERFANDDFDRLGGHGKPHIDPQAVEEDLRKLEQGLTALKEFTGKRITFYNSKPPQSLPTFKDIDTCFGVMEGLVLKYHTLLKGGALISLLPTWQYDWTAIFNCAWKSPKASPSTLRKEFQRRLQRVPNWRLGAKKQRRLSALLQKNSEGTLTPDEGKELDRLMEEADSLTLLKAKWTRVPFVVGEEAKGWDESQNT